VVGALNKVTGMGIVGVHGTRLQRSIAETLLEAIHDAQKDALVGLMISGSCRIALERRRRKGMTLISDWGKREDNLAVG